MNKNKESRRLGLQAKPNSRLGTRSRRDKIIQDQKSDGKETPQQTFNSTLEEWKKFNAVNKSEKHTIDKVRSYMKPSEKRLDISAKASATSDSSHSTLPPVRSELSNASMDKSKTDAAKHNAAIGAEVSSADPANDSYAGLDVYKDAFLDLSQDGGVECEVKWDCRSPETIKDVMKYKGQYNVEAVKKVVANFAHIHTKQVPEEPKPIRLSLFSKDHFRDVSHEEGSKQYRERLAQKRRLRGQKKSVAVQEMIDFLCDLAEKQKAEKNKDDAAKSSEEHSTEDAINKNTAISGNGPVPSTTNSSTTKEISNSLLDDDVWSDDDLFANDSFIIEATQNPEKFLKDYRDYGVVIRQKDEEKFKTSLCDNKDSLPKDSTCHVKLKSGVPFSSANCVTSTAVGFNSGAATSFQPKNLTSGAIGKYTSSAINNCVSSNSSGPYSRTSSVSTTSKSSGYNSKFSKSVTNFANSQYSTNNQQGQACGQGALKKHNSYQGNLHGQPAQGRKIIIPRSTQQSGPTSLQANASFRRSLSYENPSHFKATQRGTNPVIKPTKCSVYKSSTNQSSVTTMSNPNLCKQGLSNVAGHSKQFNTMKESVSGACNEFTKTDSKMSVEDDLFDLPDDVILQMLEPDVILDSQISSKPHPPQPPNGSLKSAQNPLRKNPMPMNNQNVIKPSVGNKNGSVSSSKIYSMNLPAKGTNKNLLPQTSKLPPSHTRRFEGGTLQASSLSPVKVDPGQIQNPGFGSPMQTFFKKSFGLTKPSHQSPRLAKHPTSSGLNTSTPVKHARKDDVVEPKDTGCSDSFLEAVFNDSFMNDDAIFESQILPMLEQAESQAETESESKEKVTSSPIQCSPEQIEQKRLAALQRRSERLSQNKFGCKW